MRKMPPTGGTTAKAPSETSVGDRAKPEWVLRIEREHAVLRTLLRALEARLAIDRPCPEWAQSVGETLGALVPMLQEHFELLTAFSRARQDCMERENDESLPEDLRADLAAAISDVRRHEVAETELLAVGRWFDLPEHR